MVKGLLIRLECLSNGLVTVQTVVNLVVRLHPQGPHEEPQGVNIEHNVIHDEYSWELDFSSEPGRDLGILLNLIILILIVSSVVYLLLLLLLFIFFSLAELYLVEAIVVTRQCFSLDSLDVLIFEKEVEREPRALPPLRFERYLSSELFCNTLTYY